jgi:hypothetical protein
LKRREAKTSKELKKHDILEGALPRDRSLKQGDKGFIFSGFVKHVVSAEQVLVAIYHVETVVGQDRFPEYKEVPELVLVHCETKGLIPGDEWVSKQKFEVTGTTEYNQKRAWTLDPIK